MLKMSKIRETRRNILRLWSSTAGQHGGDKKQAEQRLSSRIIMYVPDNDEVALKNTPGADAMEKLKNRKQSKKQKISWESNMFLGIPRTSTLAYRSWSLLSRTRRIQCACMNRDARRP